LIRAFVPRLTPWAAFLRRFAAAARLRLSVLPFAQSFGQCPAPCAFCKGEDWVRRAPVHKKVDLSQINPAPKERKKSRNQRPGRGLHSYAASRLKPRLRHSACLLPGALRSAPLLARFARGGCQYRCCGRVGRLDFGHAQLGAHLLCQRVYGSHLGFGEQGKIGDVECQFTRKQQRRDGVS
jgi:hypothetical protein